MEKVLEYCEKHYKWLFHKQGKAVINGKRKFFRIDLTPFVEDHGSHYRVYREKNASPLILGKNI